MLVCLPSCSPLRRRYHPVAILSHPCKSYSSFCVRRSMIAGPQHQKNPFTANLIGFFVSKPGGVSNTRVKNPIGVVSLASAEFGTVCVTRPLNSKSLTSAFSPDTAAADNDTSKVQMSCMPTKYGSYSTWNAICSYSRASRSSRTSMRLQGVAGDTGPRGISRCMRTLELCCRRLRMVSEFREAKRWGQGRAR